MEVTDTTDVSLIRQTVCPLLVNAVASEGNLELIEQLAVEGADFNSSDYRGRAPIHIAVIKKHLSVVKFLLKQDVNINLIDNAGKTALYYACTMRDTQMVNLLV
jgi:ankyrin repeat protein